MGALSQFIDVFISLILCVKIGYFICIASEYYLKYQKKESDVSAWSARKDYFHSTYTIMMSVLLILLFSQTLHKGPVLIDEHVKSYLAIFGYLSLFDFLHHTQS
jgi:hypothetical protein